MNRFFEESSFLRHYLWKYRWLIGVGLSSLLLVDLLEAFLPLFLKRAVDVAVNDRPQQELLLIVFAYIGTTLLQAVCRYGWRMYLIRTSVFAGRDLRLKFSGHLFSLSPSFFDHHRIGDLMSLATSDIEAVRVAIGSGLLVLADALFFFLTLPVAMYLLSPKLTLLAFVPLPIIPFLVLRNQREIHSRFEKVQDSLGHLSTMVQESLTGVRVTKAFAKEDVQLGRFKEAADRFVQLSLHLARVQTSFGPTLDLTMSFGLVLLLFVGGYFLIHDPASGITLGTFVAFQGYIQKMVWPMAAIGMAVGFYQRAVSSSGRLKEMFAISSDVDGNRDVDGYRDVNGNKDVDGNKAEISEPLTTQRRSISAAVTWRTPGGIEFRNVHFCFPGTTQKVLNGVSLRIEPGERIALIGAIGAGKSTLCSLLPRLYPISAGMVFIDNMDINNWPLTEVRRQVGYVSQEVFLFSETVTENVAFGLHDCPQEHEETPRWQVKKAVELAAVHDDILGFSHAFSTRLGERGVNLSGGQKQRLTIARALAKEPAILILDDALSSVDLKTEGRILKGLKERPGRNTEIIVAHRVSIAQEADRIVVMAGGAIQQLGTHTELIKERTGIYRKFYDQQQLTEEIGEYSRQLERVEHEL